MRVYVETNFLLELAYQQEQHPAAVGLLGHADGGRITLACPAFSIAEALANLDRRRSRRNDLLRHLSTESRELARSAPRQPLAAESARVGTELAEVVADEERQLRVAISDLASVASILPFDAAVDADAKRLVASFGLSPQDSIVLAVIVNDLAARPPAEPKLFVSRDATAYASAPVRAELRRFGCDYLSGFTAAVRRVNAILPPP